MIGAIHRSYRVNPARILTLRPLIACVALWHRRATTRADLTGLPPERLRDIGVSEIDAGWEARRPFWEGKP